MRDSHPLSVRDPFAVANRGIGCGVEAMAMFGLSDGIPLAAYGPRGSKQAIANVRDALRPGVPAVLLANHGVLVFHRTPDLAVLVGGIVEEAAEAAINAQTIGGPTEIPTDTRAAALQRAMASKPRERPEPDRPSVPSVDQRTDRCSPPTSTARR